MFFATFFAREFEKGDDLKTVHKKLRHEYQKRQNCLPIQKPFLKMRKQI
jgi:hypothetical protein